MTTGNSSQKTHIATFDTQLFMVDALQGLSLKYYVNSNNSKLKDYSIQV
jgi:predicted YcjX-like family ATPase